MKINNPCIYVGNQALVTKTYFVEQVNAVSTVINEVKDFVVGANNEIPSGSQFRVSLREQLIELSGKVDSLIESPGTGGTQLAPELITALNRIIPESISSGNFAIRDKDDNEVYFVTKNEFDLLSSNIDALSSSFSETLSNYVTTSALEETLSSYFKKGEINPDDFINESTLSGYATKDYISEKVSGALNLLSIQFDWPELPTSLVSSYLSETVSGEIYSGYEYSYYPKGTIPNNYTEMFGKDIELIFDCTISGISGKIISCYMPHNNQYSLTFPDVSWNQERNESSIHIVTNNKEDLTGWIAFIGKPVSDNSEA